MRYYIPPPDEEPEDTDDVENWPTAIVCGIVAGVILGALIWIDPLSWVMP